MNQFKGICKILLTSAVALAILHSARAADSSTTTSLPAQITASIESVQNPKAKKFEFTAILTNESDLEESSSASDTTVATLELLPFYRISSKAKMGALVAVEHDFNGLEETKLLNTTLYIRRDPIQLGRDSELALTAQGVLPTEEKARQDSSLKGAAGAIVKVSTKLLTFKKPSTLSYSLNTLKYVHEYDRSNTRSANISYRFRHIATYGLELTPKVSLGFSGYFQSGFTYDSVAKEVFYLEQEASYAINEKFSVALTHNTSGDAFERNGKDWDVKAYDSRNSSIAASLTYIY